GADLRGADLRGANLRGANLRGANLKEAGCGFTTFANVDLSETKGLETVRHVGPSTVGIDTIFRSKGRLPEAFLRGCGVPEEWIGYIQSMAKKPIEYYTCFIAHSAQDQLFCDRLHNDLQAGGVRCWYFPADARGGRGLKEEIFDRGVRLYDKVMVVCSAHSLASEPVRKEIKEGWDKERATGRLVLFPVAIDDTVYNSGDLYARLLRESRVIEDFRRWTTPEEYDKALKKLLADLKRDEPAPPSPTSA
ncbi:MAG: TIR domain-containing protein, partial [Chloroflexi bacterium]|nr:TIR domain-containing protein [Chloroflexota bacterium]